MNISYFLLVVNIYYTSILAAPVSISQLAPRQPNAALVREFDLSSTEPLALQVRMYNEDLNARAIDNRTMDSREHRLYPRFGLPSLFKDIIAAKKAKKGVDPKMGVDPPKDKENGKEEDPPAAEKSPHTSHSFFSKIKAGASKVGEKLKAIPGAKTVTKLAAGIGGLLKKFADKSKAFHSGPFITTLLALQTDLAVSGYFGLTNASTFHVAPQPLLNISSDIFPNATSHTL